MLPLVPFTIPPAEFASPISVEKAAMVPPLTTSDSVLDPAASKFPATIVFNEFQVPPALSIPVPIFPAIVSWVVVIVPELSIPPPLFPENVSLVVIMVPTLSTPPPPPEDVLPENVSLLLVNVPALYTAPPTAAVLPENASLDSVRVATLYTAPPLAVELPPERVRPVIATA